MGTEERGCLYSVVLQFWCAVTYTVQILKRPPLANHAGSKHGPRASVKGCYNELTASGVEVLS